MPPINAIRTTDAATAATRQCSRRRSRSDWPFGMLCAPCGASRVRSGCDCRSSCSGGGAFSVEGPRALVWASKGAPRSSRGRTTAAMAPAHTIEGQFAVAQCDRRVRLQAENRTRPRQLYCRLTGPSGAFSWIFLSKITCSVLSTRQRTGRSLPSSEEPGSGNRGIELWVDEAIRLSRSLASDHLWVVLKVHDMLQAAQQLGLAGR
jgi:hypothetical protein